MSPTDPENELLLSSFIYSFTELITKTYRLVKVFTELNNREFACPTIYSQFMYTIWGYNWMIFCWHHIYKNYTRRVENPHICASEAQDIGWGYLAWHKHIALQDNRIFHLRHKLKQINKHGMNFNFRAELEQQMKCVMKFSRISSRFLPVSDFTLETMQTNSVIISMYLNIFSLRISA